MDAISSDSEHTRTVAVPRTIASASQRRLEELLSDRQANLQDTRLRINGLRTFEKDYFVRQNEAYLQIQALTKHSSSRPRQTTSAQATQLSKLKADLKDTGVKTNSISKDIQELSQLLVQLSNSKNSFLKLLCF